MTIGERVRLIRENQGVTQGEFGLAIGVSGATISQIEKDNAAATPGIIRDICKVYGISREWLVDGTGERHKVAESLDDIVSSFTDLISENHGILSMVRLVSKHMTVSDWKRLNELCEKMLER